MSEKTLVKGLNVLTALAESEQPRSLSDLAAQLGITKSNAHRLLATLIEEGFVTPAGPKGHYSVTLKLWELGAGIIARQSLISVSRAYLPALAAEVSEQVNVSAFDGRETVYVERIECSHAVRLSTSIGARAPVWCTASGRIMLAHCAPARLASISQALLDHGDCTPAQLNSLHAELPALRAAGVAYNLGEWRREALAMAAPIFNARGEAEAAVAITGPSSRVTEGFLRSHEARLIDVGRKISAAMGYLPDLRPALS